MSYLINLVTRNQTDESLVRTDITNNVLTGFSTTEKLDESLDIGTIILRGIDDGTPYTMFDFIEIYFNFNLVYSLRIGGDSVSLISKNPLKYEHTLSLIEHTKILEQFVISGKTFRQPTDGSTSKTIYDVVEDLVNTNPIELEALLNTTRLFVLPTSGDLYDIMISTESPEFTFKDLTLREALNQVFGYIDAIPRLYINSSDELELSADFVNELKNIINDETNFIEKTTQQTIELYATNIESDSLNLVNDNNINEAVEIYPSLGAWTTGRSDDYTYNFLNSYLPSPKNIYSIPVLKLKSLLVDIVDGTSTTIFDSTRKYDYYTSTSVFPTAGETTILYVDLSDSELCYEWDGSAYVVSTDTTSIFPKIRFIENEATFSSTANSTNTQDIYISRETGKAYRYDSSYIELNHFDIDGELVVDVTDRILEFNTYNTKDADSGISDIDRLNPDNFYQSNTLYYNYREKNIPLGNTTGIWDTTSTLLLLYRIGALEMLADDGFISSSYVYTNYTVGINTPSPEEDMLYQLHYVPIPSSVRLNIDRQDYSDVKYNSTILSNQQGRVINLENFSNNLHGKINRIGNSELQLSNREISPSSLYNIGDYTEDYYIITEKEVIFYKDYVYANYGLSKNYNMISKFIGVNSEIRQFEMGEQNTLQRKVMYNEYCEIDIVESGNGSNNSNLVQYEGVKAFMDTFNISSEYEPVRGAIIETSEITNDLICNISSNGGGNSLIFDFQYESNVYAGQILETINSQTARNFVRYSDEVGKMESFDLNLYDKLNIPNLKALNLLELADNYPITDKSYINKTYFKNPSGYSFYTLKDNAEELGGTISLKCKSKDINKVGLGRWFFRGNRLVTETPPQTIKLYYSTTNQFTKNNNLTIPSSGWTSTTPTIVQGYLDYKTTITNISSSWTSWALTDENDRILIWCNQDGTALNVITYDFKNKLDDIKYKY